LEELPDIDIIRHDEETESPLEPESDQQNSENEQSRPTYVRAAGMNRVFCLKYIVKQF